MALPGPGAGRGSKKNIRTALAISFGKLCKGCNGGQCRDLGDEGLPHEMECPLCDGSGCKNCDDGKYFIAGCPKKTLRADVCELIDFAESFDKGLLPLPGGLLDQTRSFVAGARFVIGEKDRWKAELMNVH